MIILDDCALDQVILVRALAGATALCSVTRTFQPPEVSFNCGSRAIAKGLLNRVFYVILEPKTQ